MKKLFYIPFLFSFLSNYAQSNPDEAKQELELQQKTFAVIESRYNEQEEQRKKTPVTNVAQYDSIIKKLRVTVAELDKAYDLRIKTIDYYSAKGISKDSLEVYFKSPVYKPLNLNPTVGLPDNSNQKKIYYVFDDSVIKESDVIKNNDIQKVISKVLSEKSNAYIGNFEIPKDRQKIQLYDSNFDPVNEYLYFEKVDFSLREGSVYDIRVTLTDSKQKYYFVNRIPISLIRYMIKSSRNYLFNTVNVPLEINSSPDDKYLKLLVKMSDVLRYYNNMGNNFVTDDKNYSFPTDKDDENNSNTLRVYKIIQDTGLKNIVELRTYTDFLALLDNSVPNGLVQIEGRADFYLAPFQITRSFPMTFFKKTTPYVNFARIDEDLKDVTIVPTEANTELFGIKRPLEVIEKAYLDMGIITDVIGFSITKDFPFSTNIYIPVRYKVSEVDIVNELEDNFKTLGTGAGVRIEVKRFNNFGFTHSTEWTYFNHITKTDNLAIPENFFVFRNESEIFYFPGESKQQSIFLRLRSYLDKTDNEDSFFQLQFGYRFSIGI